ncbi:MAG: Uncharacterised protein [Rhodospirillaceae bacterium]|nr:MAG: Uncharacterised protein [Rhodospirillaceae bacterium]
MKVVVGAHFPAIGRAVLAQRPLQEHVPGARHHRPATGGGDSSLGRPRHAVVVDDRRPGCRAAEDGLRQQPDDVVSLHEPAFAVEEEAAVEVAVEGDPEIGAQLPHRVGGCLPPIGEQWVGNPIGKGPVRLAVHEAQPHLRWHSLSQCLNHRTGAAVSRVEHNVKGSNAFKTSKVHQPVDVSRRTLWTAHLPFVRRHRQRRLGGCPVPHSIHTVLAQWRSRLTNKFNAIVLSRIMAGRDHQTAICVLVPCPEVNLFRPAQTQINHISTSADQGFDHCFDQPTAMQPHIVPNNKGLPAGRILHSTCDPRCNGRVQLLWDNSTHVVSFENSGVHDPCLPSN